MRIEKRPEFSSNPWRLVNDSGHCVEVVQPFTHPDLGEVTAHRPVCGGTRKDCEAQVLALLDRLLRRDAA